jgi:hypothetical protein
MLLQITSLLWVCYWDATGFGGSDDDGDDAEAEAVAFRHWLLTLWPTPPAA